MTAPPPRPPEWPGSDRREGYLLSSDLEEPAVRTVGKARARGLK